MRNRFLTKKLSAKQIEKLRKFDWNRWKVLKIMWFVGWRLAIPLYLFGSLAAWDLLFWNWMLWLRFTVISVWLVLTVMGTICFSLVLGMAQQEAKTLCPPPCGGVRLHAAPNARGARQGCAGRTA